MCNLIVILLFLNLQVITLSATCHHTDRTLSSKSLAASSRLSINQKQNISHNSSSSVALTNLTNNSSLRGDDQGAQYLPGTTSLDPHDLNLDELRLEYYKYKIVTQLDISSDPSKLNPDIDEELRNRIQLSRNLVYEESNAPLINVSMRTIELHYGTTNLLSRLLHGLPLVLLLLLEINPSQPASQPAGYKQIDTFVMFNCSACYLPTTIGLCFAVAHCHAFLISSLDKRDLFLAAKSSPIRTPAVWKHSM